MIKLTVCYIQFQINMRIKFPNDFSIEQLCVNDITVHTMCIRHKKSGLIK